MKTKSLLLAALATALMAGCSKENGETPTPPEDMTGKAFLSLSLSSNTPVPVRAATNEEKPGSEDESKATVVTVLLFDEMNKCLGTADYSGAVIGNGSTSAAASDAKPVPAATKKIIVVVNPYTTGWDFSAAAGKTWAQINTLLTSAVIGNVATAQSFMMASAGDLTKGAMTDVSPVKPADNSTAAINAAKTSAKGSPVELKIDRLSAKVTLSLNGGGVTVPTDAHFEFQGWNLNVTNKSVRLYTDLVSYENATAGAAKGVYRKDANYTAAEQPTTAEGMKAAFNYLTNGGVDASGLSAVDKTAGSDLYCLENTMAADAQKLGYTTKAVVKAKYAPAGFNLGDSYFFWNGQFFTLDGIKAAYLTHADGTGLKVDLPEFLHKAGIMAQSVFEGDQSGKNTAVANLNASSFSATTGIVGRYCAVRYYHQSICYYDVLIRHDQNVTDKMALGRYGVVRNNWYGLQVNSVSNPGTPWIPDPTDPDDPTKPDTPDDENESYLSVKITVNPWTYWSQGVELN